MPSEYEQARSQLLQQLREFSETYALGYDTSNATKRLIQELEAEESDDA